MKNKILGITFSCLILALIMSAPAFAGDGEDSSVTYLDGLPMSQGNITIAIRLDEDSTDAPFYGRYRDPFAGENFFLSDILYRGLIDDGTYFRFRLSDTWDPSWGGSLEYYDPGDFGCWISNVDHDFFDIPSLNLAGRDDFNAGLVIYGTRNDSYGFNYYNRSSVSQNPLTTRVTSNWESNGATWSAEGDIAGLDLSLEIGRRVFDDRSNDRNDVDHTSAVFSIGRNFGDDTYIEGNAAYNLSNVANGNDLRSLKLGGYGRFLNVLGVERLNVTARVNMENNNDGPSRFHPAGSQLHTDIDGQWRVSPTIRLYLGWDHLRSDVAHADQISHFLYYADPDPFIPPPVNLIENTMATDTLNFGGRWDITRSFEFAADFNWLERESTPLTNFVTSSSSPLRWSSEADNSYSLRYDPGPGIGISHGIWSFRYATETRENSGRMSNSDAENLSLNWSGTVTDDLLVYISGGYLRTQQSITGQADISQTGREYGLGWSWGGGKWNFYGDYWKYDVNGNWGYDQTSFMAGLGYECAEYWAWALEYQAVDGDFTALAPLNYDTSDLLLKVSYNW
ncbi:hypothetical protein KAU08_08865 [bacterium]|nr:hypothetical protein [bacterium]